MRPVVVIVGPPFLRQETYLIQVPEYVGIKDGPPVTSVEAFSVKSALQHIT